MREEWTCGAPARRLAGFVAGQMIGTFRLRNEKNLNQYERIESMHAEEHKNAGARLKVNLRREIAH